MEFIMENGVLIIACIAVGVYIGISVRAFVNRPREEQIKDVKEWLLWAVNKAEEELGGVSGTGPMKLRMCYDLFITKFPAVARFIGFETFRGFVDEALEKLEEYLKSIGQSGGESE
jgi:hypothetical protein